MSRKYSSWASNQSGMNPDLSMMRLATIVGNEQDHRIYLQLLVYFESNNYFPFFLFSEKD